MVSSDAEAGAIAAIARFARMVAPCGPTGIQSVVTRGVPGELLPTASDAWLAIAPFDDVPKKLAATAKLQSVRGRRAVVEVLARLASGSSSPLRLDASATVAETVSGQSDSTFWADLVRTLDPESDWEDPATRIEMAQCLIVMGHAQRLRVLVRVTQETLPADLPDMLEQFLAPLTDATQVEDVLAECGVAGPSAWRVAVEVGLNLTSAKITPAFLTKLFDILDGLRGRRAAAGGVDLRVTALRFGSDCVFQPKALEVLGQRATRSSIIDLQLGGLRGVKPASLRSAFTGILDRQHQLRRLTTTTDSFEAVAATLRAGDASIEELDIGYEPTPESAAWLAFALFHVDSKSSVASLRLRFPRRKHLSLFEATQEGVLNAEWLTAFKRALTSTTADQDLACLEPSDDHDGQERQPRRFVTIKVGTAVKTEPYTSAKTQCKVDDASERFEVIATVNKSLAIIVPGLGVGWVPVASTISESVLATRLSAASDSIQTNRKIKSLAWECAFPLYNNRPYSGHMKVLLEVLEIVGGPLESLHLPALKLTTAELAQVTASCPNLTELNISGHAMTSIAPLVDVFASGGCKIETLNITRAGLCFDHDYVPQELTTILGGPGGSTLRRLAVNSTPLCLGYATSSVEHTGAALGLYRTLASTEALEFVQLAGSNLWGDSADTLTLRLPVDVSAHPVCLPNISLRHKLAFLSCMQSQHEDSPLHRFDARILALIFRFCCHVIARHVIMDAPIARHRSTYH